MSDGRFDITSGVLRRVWDFRAAVPRLPQPGALAEARALFGWQDVEWDDPAIRLPRIGMEIDFGGIGKEYAADRVATICREHGIDAGLVNLGGDVRAIGAQPDGRPWRVGIRHPRAPDNAITVLDVVDAAVATSGDYERYFERDGVRYCHVLRSAHRLAGRPLAVGERGLRRWRVVAGSHATIGMLSAGRAPAFLAGQGVPYVAIDSAGVLHRSPLAHAA